MSLLVSFVYRFLSFGQSFIVFTNSIRARSGIIKSHGFLDYVSFCLSSSLCSLFILSWSKLHHHFKLYSSEARYFESHSGQDDITFCFSSSLCLLFILSRSKLRRLFKTHPNEIVHQFMPKEMHTDEHVRHPRFDFALVREQRVRYYGKEYVVMQQLAECRELLGIFSA